MPKIEKHTFTHHQTGSQITTDVFFGKMREHKDYRKKGLKVFYILLTNEASQFHGENYIYADTFKEVTELWEEVMASFMESVRRYKKVIAINIASCMFDELATKFDSKNDHDDYRNSQSGRPHLNAEAYPISKLELTYHIGYILTIGEKEFWSYYNEDNQPPYSYTPDSLDDARDHYSQRDWYKYKFIEWTEEREEWIHNMYESFNKVIAQCRKFYNQNEKKIGLIMDRQTNLLGNTSEKV